MVLFYDFEMTGLHKNTTPISIGIVSEDGKKFYAEFTDYDENQCDDWIRKNVINNLRFELPKQNEDFYYVASRAQDNPIGNDLYSSYSLEMNGTTRMIGDSLKKWLSQFDIIQFVSDVCHYDFVLLIDLLTNGGTALDLPWNISAVCHDLNQDIAQHFRVPDHEAFDMSREQIMNDLCGAEDIVTRDKHNSLYDAEVIRAIWREIGNV